MSDTKPPPWTDETLKLLLREFIEQRNITRELLEVLRDIRDELAIARVRRENETDIPRKAATQ